MGSPVTCNQRTPSIGFRRNSDLSQDVRYRCTIYLGIIFQAQVIVFPNISQQLYQTLDVYFTKIL